MHRIAVVMLAVLTLYGCTPDSSPVAAPPPPNNQPVDTLALRASDSLACLRPPAHLTVTDRSNARYWRAFVVLYSQWSTWILIANTVTSPTEMRLDQHEPTEIWMRWYDHTWRADVRFYGRVDSVWMRGHAYVRHPMKDTVLAVNWHRYVIGR